MLFKKLKNYRVPVLCFISIILMVDFFIYPLSAQTPEQLQTIRGTAEPARAAEATTPISQPIPQAEPGGGTLIPQGTLPPEVAKIKFNLRGLRIKNPIIFSSKDLIAPYRCKFGSEITLGELQGIVNEMTQRYQKCGYVLTQVILPEQIIKGNGIVTLQVVSSKIHKIIIRGVQPCPAKLIYDYAKKIKCCYPLHIKTLERYSLLINDIPGMEVKAVLTASKKPGATDLIFEGCQTLEEASLNVNNINSVYVGPTQLILNGTRNSWFTAGDQAQAYLVSTGDGKLNYGQFSYGELLNSEGLRYNALYRKVRSRPGSTLLPLHVQGNNEAYSYELLYPFMRSREENLYFQGGINILNDQVNLLGSTLYNDRTRPLYGSLIYNLADEYQGVNQFQLMFSKGLGIFHASGSSRPDGEAKFTKINWSLSRTQNLPGHFSFYAGTQGQFGLDSLLVAQQFSFGGRDIGRGYDPTELLGDSGINATVELRYDLQHFPFINECVNSTQFYAFYDAGAVWNNDTNPPPRHQTATSAGGGFRIKIMKCIDGNFYLGKPISKVVNANGKKHVRGFFSLAFKLY